MLCLHSLVQLIGADSISCWPLVELIRWLLEGFPLIREHSGREDAIHEGGAVTKIRNDEISTYAEQTLAFPFVKAA